MPHSCHFNNQPRQPFGCCSKFFIFSIKSFSRLVLDALNSFNWFSNYLTRSSLEVVTVAGAALSFFFYKASYFSSCANFDL
jgi:hypothetical protein